MSALTSILIILALVFGGSGAAMAASQDALPGDALFPVKLALEDTRLALTADPVEEINLSLGYAQLRIAELGENALKEREWNESAAQNLRQRIDRALELAVGLPVADAQRELLRIREQLTLMVQSMDQLRLREQDQAGLIQTMTQVQERLGWVENGAQTTQQIQEQLRQQLEEQNRSGQPASSPQQGEGGSPSVMPGQQQNQNGQATPQPSQTNPQGNDTPGAGNPWTDSTPTPYSGYGPGPGDGSCQTCTPQNSGKKP